MVNVDVWVVLKRLWSAHKVDLGFRGRTRGGGGMQKDQKDEPGFQA